MSAACLEVVKRFSPNLTFCELEHKLLKRFRYSFYGSEDFGCLSVYVAGASVFGLLQHCFATLYMFYIAAMLYLSDLNNTSKSFIT